MKTRGLAPEKVARVERIVRGLLDQQRAGNDVDYAAVEEEHPDLAPHLGARLRRLRAIKAAQVRAREYPETGGLDDSEFTPAGDDIAVLRDALEGYDIVERVHYGGQGVVYRAIQLATNREVAIKVLLDGPLATPRQVERFSEEVKLLSRLRHPNIVSVFESGVVRGRNYVVIEYVDGLPIDDYVLLHAKSVREIVELMQTVCDAVAYAHQHAIIHRDLKPSNILVDREGSPRVLDFGLAKDIGDWDSDGPKRPSSEEDHVVGTFPYLAPEMASGWARLVDMRADIYSLGVVLFELLTGCYPYPMDLDMRVVRENILKLEPETVRNLISRGDALSDFTLVEIDDDLDCVVNMALCKDINRRYQTALALYDDLGRYLKGEAVEAKSANTLYVLWKTVLKYRVQVTVAAAFTFLLAFSSVGMTVLWKRADTVAKIAQAGLEMGSYIKLGSVARDEARVDQAVEMFKKALEIGDTVPSSDPVVQRARYDALHRLAELYLEEGEYTQAVGYVKKAIPLVETVLRAHPDDLEWVRLSGFAHVLGAKAAASAENHEDAIREIEKAIGIRERLIAEDRKYPRHKYDLADAHNLHGKCLRELQRVDDAIAAHVLAHELYADLAVGEPDVLDYSIELSRTELHLTTCYLSRRTRADDRRAEQWLNEAEGRLTALREADRLGSRDWDVKALFEAIGTDRRILARRASRTSEGS